MVPFFINENGSSITRPQLVKVLKSQLTHLNYDATLYYNTHSFRIGRASVIWQQKDILKIKLP